MYKRGRAEVTLSRTRVATPTDGELITLNAKTGVLYVENRSSKQSALVGVVFGTTDAVTMDANLTEATTVLGPGVGRYIGRPSFSNNVFPGPIGYAFVRANAAHGDLVELDVEEIVT